MKKLYITLMLALLVLALTGCTSVALETTSAGSSAADAAPPTPVAALTPITVDYTGDTAEAAAQPDSAAAPAVNIWLQGDTVTVEGAGAAAQGSVVTITAAGEYLLSGVLTDGQVVVESTSEAKVTLVLNGVDINNSTGPAIYVKNADKVTLTLAQGTENRVADGAEYVFETAGADEPNAAIFSKDDLTINGTGALTVQGNYNHGVFTKDDLKITGGALTVMAVNDGIKGRNSIAIQDGVITITAGGDGMQASNTEDAEKGYVVIDGGTLALTTGQDGIQAETRLLINGGGLSILTAGGSQGVSGSVDSAKGLKAGVEVAISGGTVQVDALDDAVHSDNSITINAGTLQLASADDGIHAEAALVVNGGEVFITRSYEGIESAVITFNGGSVYVASSDDGINTSGGTGGGMGGGPGQGGFQEAGNYPMYIYGGYIYVDANGDGLDINGPIQMTDGMVIVNGPIRNDNGALDYTGNFTLTGGFLVAVGSAGMAQAPTADSTQYAAIFSFPSAQAAGTLVHIESQSGANILTFAPTKAYQSVVISSPELANGETYVVYTGGSATGTAANGLYTEGEYTPGAQATSFTIASIITGSGGMGGPGGTPGRTRPGRP